MKTLSVLQQSRDNLGMLPLASVLENTLRYEELGWRSNPSVLLASNLRSTWKYVVNAQGKVQNICTCSNKGMYT